MGTSGNNVILLASGQFENGTLAETNMIGYDFVKNGITNIVGPELSYTMSFSSNEIVYKIIRLNSAWLPVSGILVGAILPETDPLFWDNTTVENRTYLGVSRTVNVCRYTFAHSNDNATVVYDKTTGMMLEMAAKVPDLISVTIIETNIFGPTSTPMPTITPTSTPMPTITPTSTPMPTITPTSTPMPTITPTPGSHDPSPSVPEFTPVALIATLAVISIALLVYAKRTSA